MRAVIQRVEEARVDVDGESSAISRGLLVLLGVGIGDTEKDVSFLKKKIKNLRLFADDEGKMNLSIAEVGGEILVVSQFTLYGDCRKGNRPSYSQAAPPVEAQRLYDTLVRELRDEGLPVKTGKFQAMMKVTLVNDGPVTLIVDSKEG